LASAIRIRPEINLGVLVSEQASFTRGYLIRDFGPAIASSASRHSFGETKPIVVGADGRKQ